MCTVSNQALLNTSTSYGVHRAVWSQGLQERLRKARERRRRRSSGDVIPGGEGRHGSDRP